MHAQSKIYELLEPQPNKSIRITHSKVKYTMYWCSIEAVLWVRKMIISFVYASELVAAPPSSSLRPQWIKHILSITDSKTGSTFICTNWIAKGYMRFPISIRTLSLSLSFRCALTSVPLLCGILGCDQSIWHMSTRFSSCFYFSTIF